jgi:hypothetical protein
MRLGGQNGGLPVSKPQLHMGKKRYLGSKKTNPLHTKSISGGAPIQVLRRSWLKSLEVFRINIRQETKNWPESGFGRFRARDL